MCIHCGILVNCKAKVISANNVGKKIYHGTTMDDENAKIFSSKVRYEVIFFQGMLKSVELRVRIRMEHRRGYFRSFSVRSDLEETINIFIIFWENWVSRKPTNGSYLLIADKGISWLIITITIVCQWLSDCIIQLSSIILTTTTSLYHRLRIAHTSLLIAYCLMYNECTQYYTMRCHRRS